MATALASAFQSTHRPEALRAWLEGEPRAAAEYLKRVSQAAHLPGVASALDDFLGAPTPEKRDRLVQAYAELERRGVGDLQTSRAHTLEWTGDLEPDPPAITGTISIETNFTPVLTTASGRRYVLMNSSRWTSGPPEHYGQDWHTTVGRDLLAFAGYTVTVRGWPDDTWSPDAPPGVDTHLLVEDFAPGTSTDYTEGRVMVVGDDVLISVRGNKSVKLTDAALASELRPYDQMGIILPGAPRRTGVEDLVYDRNPEAYWALGGFALAQDAVRVGGKVRFTLQLAHGKRTSMELDASVWDKSDHKGMRVYFYGRFEHGLFHGTAMSGDADHWDGPRATEVRSSRFINHATEVDAPASTDGSFGPQPAKSG